MFRNTRTIRTASLGMVMIACLVAAMGADCAEDSTGGMFDLGLNSTSTSGPLAGALSGNPGPVPELSVGASRSSFNPGDTIGFGASVVGGQSPYYFFWMRSDHSGWSQGGPTWSTVADFPAGESRTVYAQVIDSNGIESNLVEVTLTNGAEQQQGCPSIQGNTWSLSNGVGAFFEVNGNNATGMVFSTIGLPLQKLSGTLTRGDGACSGCTVFAGTWTDDLTSVLTDSAPKAGPFRFVFEPDNMSFIGKWANAGVSHWEGNWSGSRSDCTFNRAGN